MPENLLQSKSMDFIFLLLESFLESSQKTTDENNTYLPISFFTNKDVICAPPQH